MDYKYIKDLLTEVKDGRIDIEDAVIKLRHLPFEDLGFVKIDHHRHIRCGFPEVIYCPGKEKEHIAAIFEKLAATGHNVLASRATPEVYECIKAGSSYKNIEYDKAGKAVILKQADVETSPGSIAIVTGGTSDLPVAHEARVTAEVMGQNVEMIADVGVAGIHRLLPHVKAIQKANVVIAVAGMEGALASVVGGLVDSPVIAVPTSVGYGAAFDGLAALLTMLNSCASGVTVVNIDNGFGAGYTASIINQKISQAAKK